MVFMKMTLTYSGLICLIENKLLNVTMKYLKCVISTLVFRKDLFYDLFYFSCMLMTSINIYI